ncbi:MAG TPA: hypothetical protein VGH22_13365 [Candidatus Binatia bacterium]|jgi:DNA-binding response OmpR family regulator
MSSASEERKRGKMMLVGLDQSHILEKRLKAAGYEVFTVSDGLTAIEHVRREPLDFAVLVSSGSLVNVADTAFNLRDLNRLMEIIILVNRLRPRSSRFLRPLLEQRTRVLTRRQLQKELNGSAGRGQGIPPR